MKKLIKVLKKDYLIILLVIIGLSGAFGYFFDNSKPKKFIKGLRITPAPYVFINVAGSVDNPEVYIFDFVNKNKEHHIYTKPYELYSKVKGPLNRREVYGHGLNPKYSNDIRDSIFNYGLCNNGPVSQMLNIGLVQSVHLYKNSAYDVSNENPEILNCN